MFYKGKNVLVAGGAGLVGQSADDFFRADFLKN